MNIALIDPASHAIQHRVRGAGFYADNLTKSLKKYYPEHNYIFSFYANISKADIVHFLFFEPFFKTLPFLKRGKTVATVHDLTPLVFPQNFPAGLKGKIKWNLQKLALKKLDAIITDSKSSKKDIVKFTGINEEKIKVIYLAAGEQFRKLEIGNWKLEIKRKYGLPDRFLLYVGDATWNKNLVRLVEAIKRAQIPLIMTGKTLIDTDYDKKNPWNKDLAKVQNMILNDGNIIRLGFVPEDDLISLYNAATVFIMPSLYEGFGLPILEAMSCGCPVVTSKQGSIPEIAQDAAFYVDAYDINDIADGIKKVFLNNDLRSQLSKKGLEQAKKFSWKKTASQTMNVYKEVIGL